LTPELIERVRAGKSPAALYVGKYARLRGPYDYLWDELAAAAWLDPTLITKKEVRLIDVDLDRGANYGNVLAWGEQDQPKVDVPRIEVQVDLDTKRFYDLFVSLLTAPTPSAAGK
jgi:inosine-uridine nucleoside N-ribohydrolase